MNTRKCIALACATVMVSFSMNIAQASYIKWKDLTAIEQGVLIKTVSIFEWNTFSEAKQKKLLKKHSKKIRTLRLSKLWFYNKLTIEERSTFYKNLKKMGSKSAKFRKYVDSLTKKYGKPSY